MIERNKDLTRLTTFGIPAKARYYTEYGSVEELKKLMRSEVYRNNAVMHIGGGSNLLFLSDYDGLIIKSHIYGRTLYRKDSETIFAIAGAAEDWEEFVKWTIDEGLAGLENLSLIPGQVGASAVQNIGAYGVEASDAIHAVEVFDTLTGEVKRLKNHECEFGYRDSIFKHSGRGRYYVLRVSFKLNKSAEASNLTYGPLKGLGEKLGHAPTPSEVREEVIAIRKAKLPDPAETGSAGSFFKNPIINAYYFREVVQPLAPDMPYYQIGEDRVKLSAAWLIDHAGLKDEKIGGAEIWHKQCLVITNNGGASSADVVALAEKVQLMVKRKYAVDLYPEVNYVDTRITVTILGSGTSKGVPEIGCGCRVCASGDSRDKRLRSSVLVSTNGSNILIDPSPDFRQQALIHNITQLDAVLITHSHYDHVGGLDDLRPFCINANVPLYAQKDVFDDLRRRLDYCFKEHPYPGVPVFATNEINSREPFFIGGVKVNPIKIMHGRLPILGFRIGKFAYVTDASEVPDGEMYKLEGIDTLIVNALRHRSHFAHFNLRQALEFIKEVQPQRAYLTHLCHEMGLHDEEESRLPKNVKIAYDGLKIIIV